MTETVRAEVVLKEERCDGVRVSEFQYTYCCDGLKHGSTLNLVTVDFDLEIVWIITRDYSYDNCLLSCKWTWIEIKESNQNFFGNLEIICGGDVYKNTFDTKSLPIWKHPMPKYCDPGQEIKIKIQVFRVQVTSPIIKAYDKLLENKALADVTFIIGDEEIPANKSILSLYSDVFAKMFESDMIEKKSGRVEITDIEPKVFKMLLQLIFSGKLYCNDLDELLKLSVAADKYELRNLVDLCGYRISYKLTVYNVIDIFILADQARSDFLKKECIRFIIKNKEKVVGTESYENLSKSGRTDLSLLKVVIDCLNL